MKAICFGMIAVLGLTGPFVAPTAAAEQTVQVASRYRELPEAGHVMETVLLADRFEVAFIPPTDWKASADSKGFRWHWSPRDRASLISLQIQANEPAVSPPLDRLRQDILARHAPFALQEEFPCYMSAGRGVGFVFSQGAGGHGQTLIQVYCVPFAGGFVELTLTTSKEMLPRTRHALTSLMNSLRITPRS